MSEKRWKTPAAYPVCSDLRVRFRDLDPFGHLNNGVYLSYFEEARIDYFSRLPFVQSHIESGDVLGALTGTFPSVVIRASVEYRAEAKLHEALKCCVRISSVKKSFIEFEYGIFRVHDQKYMGGGRTTLLAVDPKSKKPVSVPPHILKEIEQLEEREVPYVQ